MKVLTIFDQKSGTHINYNLSVCESYYYEDSCLFIKYQKDLVRIKLKCDGVAKYLESEITAFICEDNKHRMHVSKNEYDITSLVKQ